MNRERMSETRILELEAIPPMCNVSRVFLQECLEEIRAQRKDLDKFWKALQNYYDIEPREFFEEQAPKIGTWNALEMALHHVWKRDPKVSELVDALEDLFDPMLSRYYCQSGRIQKCKCEICSRERAKEILRKAGR